MGWRRVRVCRELYYAGRCLDSHSHRRRRKGGRYRAFESDDPVEEVELGKRAPLPAPTKASSLPAASNLPPAERPSSDDAGSAEEWEARDGGGFELRINS